MKKTGFYIIKDKFFEDMPDPYLKEKDFPGWWTFICNRWVTDKVTERVTEKTWNSGIQVRMFRQKRYLIL